MVAHVVDAFLFPNAFLLLLNVITNLHNLKEKICVCHLYESCLEEYFCEFDAPDAFWTVTDYRKEAVPNYCCVCGLLMNIQRYG